MMASVLRPKDITEILPNDGGGGGDGGLVKGFVNMQKDEMRHDIG